MTPNTRIQQEMDSLSALHAWISESVAPAAPKELEGALADVLKYLNVLSGKSATSRGMTRNFLRAIGILPKSEKSKKYGLGKLTGDTRDKLRDVSLHALDLLYPGKKRREKGEAVKEPVLGLSDPQDESAGRAVIEAQLAAMATEPRGDAEGGLSREEFRALEADAIGPVQEADPACVFSPASEAIFGAQSEGYVCANAESRELAPGELEKLKASPTDSIAVTSKTHTRIGFQIVVERTDVEVQSAFSRESGASLRADTSDLGPAKSRITWDGLVSLMTLMVGYLVPANRISLLLGSVGSYFTAARCVTHLVYVAQRLLPIHLAHARALGSARLLQTDDTPARCPELVRAKAAKEADESFKLPWADWKQKNHPDKPALPKSASLMESLSYELGFENRNKSGGIRKDFNTTVVIGKADENDLSSFIVLYHSHLGQAGDLIANLLRKRKDQRREQNPVPLAKETVFLVSDLLKTNPPTDPSLREDFDIVWGGCMHHARRNFVLAADDDYVNCTQIRMLFDAIAMYERELTEAGRRASNVLAVREKITGPLWEVILSQSQALAERWPRGHPVGKAARFVISHFDKLTVHCKHAHMPDNNTLSERMLRAEKIMQRSSLFRWSLQGRGAWNIVRGVHQTCSLAGVDFSTYLRDVLGTDSSEVDAHPERFTPHAFARRKKS